MALEHDDDSVDLSKLDRGDAPETPPGETTPPPAGGEPTPPPSETPTPSGDDKGAPPPVDTPPPADDKATPPPAATDDAAPKKGIMIPKERLDEVNERRKAAELAQQKLRDDYEARLKAMEEDLKRARGEDTRKPEETPGTPEWFDAQEKSYMQLVLDGKEDEAIAKRREIRNEEVKVRDTSVQTRANEAVIQRKAVENWESAVTELEGRFPELDSKHDKYDDEMVQAIIGAQKSILGKNPGMLPGDALKRAAARFGYNTEKSAEPETPPVAAPATPPPAAPKAPVSTPPRGGSDQTRKTETRVNEDTIKSMDERALAIARGDLLPDE